MTTGVFYGDASGGAFSSMPRIRRIGCGLVQIDESGSLIWGQHFNLPGSIQTVPRGGLYVLFYLIHRLEPYSHVTYVTDNQKVRYLYNQGETAALKSTNCDLFRDIFDLKRIRALSVHVRCMPAHLKSGDPRPAGISELDVVGNDFADKQAGMAAHQHAVPLNVSATHIYYYYYYSLVRKIQRRIIDIIISMPHRKHVKVHKPFRMFDDTFILEDLIATSQHIPFFVGSRIRCARCLDNLPIKGDSTKQWLRGNCNAVGTISDRPVRLHHNIIQIGRQSTHPSHQLTIFRGHLFCNVCGCKGISKLHHLAVPCSSPGPYGLEQLRAIRNSKFPQGVTEWPDPNSIHAGTTYVPHHLEVIRTLVLPEILRIRAE